MFNLRCVTKIFYVNNTNQYKCTERSAVDSIITKTQWKFSKINTEYNIAYCDDDPLWFETEHKAVLIDYF